MSRSTASYSHPSDDRIAEPGDDVPSVDKPYWQLGRRAAVIAACTGAGTMRPRCFRAAVRRDTTARSPARNAARYPARLDCLLREYTDSRPENDPSRTRSSSTDGIGARSQGASHPSSA